MMYLMYVDESGDGGQLARIPEEGRGSSEHYALTGFIVPSSGWRRCHDELLRFRNELARSHSIPLNVELKGAHLIHPRGSAVFSRIPKRERIRLYHRMLAHVSTLPDVAVISVYHDKRRALPSSLLTEGLDVQLLCWGSLLLGFERYLKTRSRSMGIIIADQTEEVKLRNFMRRMQGADITHRQNPRSTFALCEALIIEDAVMRDSRFSYFIQTADMIVHSLYRYQQQKGSLRHMNADRLYERLRDVIVRDSAPDDPCGIVHV